MPLEPSSKTSNQREAVQVQTLNLPKGGGAIRGMGEQLQVDAFTGSLNISLPLEITACRDFTPELELAYTSSVGNGVWGMGVELNLPSIVRRTNQGVPLYNNQDVFLMTGADYLVPLDGAIRQETLHSVVYQVQKYAPCIENQFAWIEYWQADIQSFWRVIHRDHHIQIFGFSAQARINDPQQPDHVFQWLLEESYDTKGQHHLYFYKAEDNSNVPLEIYEKNREPLANRYLQSVRYGNFTSVQGSLLFLNHPDLKEADQWHFEIVLDYGEYQITPSNPYPYQAQEAWACRPDIFSSYRAGFEIRTYRRCENILMFHRFPEEFPEHSAPILVHVMQYTYQTLPCSQLSVLHKVQSIGYCCQKEPADFPYKTTALPAVLLDYQDFQPTQSQFSSLARSDEGVLAGVDLPPNYQLVDLWGEGLPGILYADGQTVSYQKLVSEIPTLQYQSPQVLKTFPLSKSTTFMDLDASGQMDLVVLQADCKGYYSSQAHESSWKNFSSFNAYPSHLGIEGSQWVDLTGNGLADFVVLDQGQLFIYPALGAQGWGEPYQQKVTADFPLSLNSLPTKLVSFSDLSGSGLPQLVEISRGEVKYWPSLGYGRFGKAISMKNAPLFDSVENFSIDRLFVVDLDGSGASDLVYLFPQKAVLYINQSGNAFSDPIEIPLLEELDSLDQIRFVDLSGKGTIGMLMSLLHGEQGPSYFYYDFCQGNKPYLLTRLDNQQGGSTRISYQSSVHYYLKDKRAGRPWKTTLPFPVQVVAETMTEDIFSQSQIKHLYQYHHGYYDGVEREFRGFACVETQDSEKFADQNALDPHYVKPALTKTWYSLGSKGDTFSRQFIQDYYSGDTEAFPFPDSQLVSSTDAATAQQSYRALKGQVLRTEVYGLDAHPRSDCPYVVSETNYEIEVKQAKGNHPYAIFYVYPQQSIQYQYERNPQDPRIHQEIQLKIDAYGNVLQSCSIDYPRRPVETALLEQRKLYVELSTAQYINCDDLQNYVLGVLSETRQYHVHGLMPEENQAFGKGFLDKVIKAYLESLSSEQPSSKEATLYDWQRYYYAEIIDQTTQALPLREVVLPVLLYRQSRAAFLQNELNEIFEEVLSPPELQDYLKQAYWDNQESTESPQYWWSPGYLQYYHDEVNFYLPSKAQDPAGYLTNYAYDQYRLLLIEIKDALDNKTQITGIDYQLLEPNEICDSNGNYSAVSYDALGRVVYTSFYGHEANTAVGFSPISQAPHLVPVSIEEILRQPEEYLGGMASYYFYDDEAYLKNQQPIVILELNASHYPAADAASIEIQLQYQDGLGRDLQSKILSEDGMAFVFKNDILLEDQKISTNRWLASGKKVYNNKGLVVKEYDPYYINLAEYIQHPILETYGDSDTFYYDPLNRLYQTLTPKGFLKQQEWSAWFLVHYDENDSILSAPYYLANNPEDPQPLLPYYDPNILPQEKEALIYAAKYYANTPTSSLLDSRGLIILKQEENCYPNEENQKVTETLQTIAEYDEVGRLLLTQDPRFHDQGKGVYNSQNFYSTLLGPAFKFMSVDAGSTWEIPNVFGNLVFTRNSRNAALFITYDELQRPLSKKVLKKDSLRDPLSLDQVTEYFIYGESQAQDQGYNLRGKLYKHYDQAGMITYPSYSLLGHSLETKQCLRQAYQEEVNWPSEEGERLKLLQDHVYNTSINYDALGRVVKLIEVDGSIVQPFYYVSGRLSNIQVSTSEIVAMYVQNIVYDAKSQRLSLKLGNGTVTTYTYEAATWRLRHIENVLASDPNTVPQSLAYQYDPCGNVLAKTDATQARQFYRNQKIDPQFAYQYDALYRLIQATGREVLGQKLSHSKLKMKILNFGRKDLQALQNYVEQYSYDIGGNLLKKQHQSNSESKTIDYVVSGISNRSIMIPPAQKALSDSAIDEDFDLCGNLLNLSSEAKISWDYRNQLQSVILIERPNSHSDAEYYVYDASGQRVRKVVCRYAHQETMVNMEETIYLGNVEIRCRLQGPNPENAELIEEYHSLRVLDEGDCIATRHQWVFGEPPTPFKSPNIVYHLKDLLGSHTIEVDDQGGIISREEYYPYGGRALFEGIANSEILKHYRYSGQEQDNATGLYYYGARYYAPWLCRWVSPDPAGPVDGLNLYLFVRNNPITYKDNGGMVGKKPNHKKQTNQNNKTQTILSHLAASVLPMIAPIVDPNAVLKSVTLPNNVKINNLKIPNFVKAQYDNHTETAVYVWSKSVLKARFVDANTQDKSLYLYIKSQIRYKYANANESIRLGMNAFTSVDSKVGTASDEWIKENWKNFPAASEPIPRTPSKKIDIRASLLKMAPPQLSEYHTGSKHQGQKRQDRTVYVGKLGKAIFKMDVDEFIARNQGGQTILTDKNINNQGPLNAFVNSTSGAADKGLLNSAGPKRSIKQYYVKFE